MNHYSSFHGFILCRTVFWCGTLIFMILCFQIPSLEGKLVCNTSTDMPHIYFVPEHSVDINFLVNQNSSKSSVWSKLLFQDCKVNIEFICNASYPIEWVEHSNKDIDLNTSNIIQKDLWTDRIINETLLEQADFSNFTNDIINNPALTSYKSFLGVKYGNNSLCAAANYTCKSVSNSCLQSSVISTVDEKTKTIRYEHSKVLYEEDEDLSTGNSPCEAVIEVAVLKEKRSVGWKCTSSQKNQKLIPYARTCDAAVHCNSYFRHYKHQHCVKRLPENDSCFGCGFQTKSKGFLRHPGHVWCENDQKKILSVVHYFFSIPQSVDEQEMPELYLNWKEANPQKMLYLEPLPTPIYIGEIRTFFCKISRYYFSFGHRFGFEYLNGTILYTPSTDGEHDMAQNVNRMSATVNFTDQQQTLKRVYCFAPVWNSSVWINQSLEVRISADGVKPSFPAKQGTEKVTFDLHQINATLSCKASGTPTPDIKWIYDGKDVITTEIEIDQGTKNLIFHIVTESVKGKYICEATNSLGTTTMVFSVNIRDTFTDFIRNTSILGAVLFTTFLILLGISGIKLRRQRKQLRALTDAEVKEFREGNLELLESKDYLDTHELLQALPYNDQYEIPMKRLYVDPSQVLGKGNFGEVLKGMLSDGHDKERCNVVAVKTNRPKDDMSFFETLLTEVKIMAYIGPHINIVSMVGACTKNIKNRQIYIAFEYCSKGSLEKFLKSNRPSFVNLICDDVICTTTSFSENESKHHTYKNLSDTATVISTLDLLKWSREIANGMEFLGSKKIVHGDLAARNILLSDELIAKIGDFGLSRVMKYSNYIRSTEKDCVLPWAWLAPETLQDLKFSVMSDVWSYGVTLWEIFTLAQQPYGGAIYNTAFIDWLKSGHRLHKPFYANSEIYNLMMECWSLEPSERLSFTEMKDFFEGLLLQSNGDYVCTKSNDIDVKYNMNGSRRTLHVQNPGYAVLGEGNAFSKINESKSNTSSLSPGIHASASSSEDFQGYLKPLMKGYDNEFDDDC